jgi:uncharacterized protein YjiS (DUF1127 family)
MLLLQREITMNARQALSQRQASDIAERMPHLARTLIALFGEWRRRSRSRRALLTLGGRDLHDLCLSRADVEHEAGKPFWRE